VKKKLSITTRLTLLFAGSSATVLLALGVLITNWLDIHFANEDFASLEERVELIQKINAESTRDTFAPKLAAALGNYPGFIAKIDSKNGQVIYASSGFDFAKPVALAETRDHFSWVDNGRKFRGVVHRSPQNAPDAKSITVLLGLSADIHEHFMGSFTQALFAFVLAATVVCGLLGWWAARRGIQPLRAISSQAQNVSANQLHERMPVEDVPLEIAELAHTLNAMLARLQQDFQRLSDFSIDIAHELRTPITNMMTQTQVTLTQQRSNEKYQEILASNAEEMQRLGRMISDMLYLAKTENGLNLPNVENIFLGEEALALCEFYEALAEDKGLILSSSGEATIRGDKLMIRRALSNLLSNAIRHAYVGTNVDVAIEENANRVNVSVSNKGNTISAEQGRLIFDRFYRSDKSRNKAESEGVGLGLSITKAIVEAHHGEIVVVSTEDAAVFNISFFKT
jgi:two-component system heavy metal sensor histidine kinase CusS